MGLRENPKIKDIEWRLRAKIMPPVVSFIQSKIGEKIIKGFKFEDSNKIVNYFKNKTIAIIGNSPILDKKNYGKYIDKNDIVIRFNKGILNLKEEKTGLKTDIWSTLSLDTLTSKRVYREIINNKLNIDFLLTPYPCEKNDFYKTYLQSYILNKIEGYKKINKYFMNLILFKEIADKVGDGFYPSSGLSILNFLLNYTEAEIISMYGFTFSTINRISGNSYSKVHNFKKEEEIVENFLLKNPKKLKKII